MSEAARLIHRFNPDVRRLTQDGARITIDVVDWNPISFVPPAGIAAAIRALSDGATRAQLEALCEGPDGPGPIGRYLERFAFGRLLCWDIQGACTFGSVTALSGGYQPAIGPLPAEAVAFSRFAYLRRDGDRLVVEAGDTRARLVLTPAGAAAVVGLLSGRHPVAPGSLAETLWRCGFMATADESDARRTWEFHDLIMHEASRLARDAIPTGATYRFRDVMPPPPVRPQRRGRIVPLAAPDDAAVGVEKGSLDDLLERRHSVRRPGPQPLSVDALARFLWRVARTRRDRTSPAADHIERPYPSGGCLHELEFHVAVTRCDGLAPGLYHYDGDAHDLRMVADSADTAARMGARATAAMAQPAGSQPPDVVVVLSSRLPRLASKYEGVTYRLTLLNAGVALGLMYFVATDMGLAPCALGSGDSRLFTAATGIDPFEETSVAEFALSRRDAA